MVMWEGGWLALAGLGIGLILAFAAVEVLSSLLVGLVQVVVGRSPRKIGSGISTMLFGGWFFIATNHVWGLTWGNSWPLALVAAGVGMVSRSILFGIMRRDEEPGEARHDL